MKTVEATEYITPLREGGSLPAIVRADDGKLYVMKFVGAGQGPKALIAEYLGGEIARQLEFMVPELVFIELDPLIGRSEPDAEIQDLLNFSAGLNLGLAFLPESSAFNLAAFPDISSEFASKLVWLDAFITNVDRTPRNVNMLIHQGEVWLIDHGASLYFQHSWQDHFKQAESVFPMIKDHVLLALAGDLAGVDQFAKDRLNAAFFEKIVAEIPGKWLENSPFESEAAHRRGLVEFLSHRLQSSQVFLKEAERARAEYI